MNDRIADLWERYGPLLAGAAASAVLYPLVAWLGPGDEVAPGLDPLAVLVGGMPAIAAVAYYAASRAREGRERERRFVELNVRLRKQEATLERMAMTDALTGLPNRRYLFERLDLEMGRAVRYERPLALIIVDIDHFKRVNDIHGHRFGDFVLTEAARVLRNNLRESDVVARYGGEEFAVLLPETNVEQAEAVAEKLRGAFAERELRERDAAVALTISAGVAATSVLAVEDGETLVARADAALYEAKRQGRDRVVRAAEAEPAAAEG